MTEVEEWLALVWLFRLVGEDTLWRRLTAAELVRAVDDYLRIIAVTDTH